MSSALLDLPEVRQRISPLSVEEYHRLDEYNENGRRTELIRGFVIEKMSKSPLHRAITSRLYQFFLRQLPEDFSVWKEEPLTLRDSEPEPDIAVTRGHPDQFITAHPTIAELVVEIAVSSPALDRANASLYAEAGVTEYWIILAQERRIEIHRQPSHGHYQVRTTAQPGDCLACPGLPNLEIHVADLFPAL